AIRISRRVVLAPGCRPGLGVAGSDTLVVPGILAGGPEVAERLGVVVLVAVTGYALDGYPGHFGALACRPDAGCQEPRYSGSARCSGIFPILSRTLARSPDDQINTVILYRSIGH